MKPLTPKEGEVYDFIMDHRTEYRFSPTITEIAEHFKFNRNAAWEHVDSLVKKGALTRVEGHRNIRGRRGFRKHVR